LRPGDIAPPERLRMRPPLAVGQAGQVGCIIDITLSDPMSRVVSLTSPGISTKQTVKLDLFVGTFADEDFSPGDGIRSVVREIVPDFHFGVVQVHQTTSGAQVQALLGLEGNSFAAGFDISELI